MCEGVAQLWITYRSLFHHVASRDCMQTWLEVLLPAASSSDTPTPFTEGSGYLNSGPHGSKE